jgi:hypothetical protein
MICEKCKGMIVLHAFDNGNCEICDAPVVTGHIPCYKLCSICAETNALCEQCGKPMDA